MSHQGRVSLGLGQGAEGVGVGGAGGVGAVGEFADDLERALEGEDAVEAVVADVQGALAQASRPPARR